MKTIDKKIAFTICSINYLAQAVTLGNSLTEQNPDYTFIIALVDKIIEPTPLFENLPYPLIEVDKINIQNFKSFYSRYNITELNTAVKPYFFDYLFNCNPEVDSILYFDPDIYVYNKFTALEAALDKNQIILTPHITEPIFDAKTPGETDFLNTGLYNLGFIGLKRGVDTFKLLEWWKERLKYYCYIDFEKGLFVDQIWLNFAPIFFKNVFILHDPGYNMAYWNLHERIFSQKEDGQYIVNCESPLVFYHFSGYDFNKIYEISKYQTRTSFMNRPELFDLFNNYKEIVMSFGHSKFQQVNCYYINKKLFKKVSLIKRTGQFIKNYLFRLFQKIT